MRHSVVPLLALALLLPDAGTANAQEEPVATRGFYVGAGVFNRHLAVEASYLDADGMGFDDSLVYVPDLLDLYNTDVDLDAPAAAVTVLGIFPFLRIWEVYARLGLALWDALSEQRLVPSLGGASLDTFALDVQYRFGGE